jgi:hypothetical protein
MWETKKASASNIKARIPLTSHYATWSMSGHPKMRSLVCAGKYRLPTFLPNTQYLLQLIP